MLDSIYQASIDRSPDPFTKETGVDLLVRVERPDAGTDLGVRRVGSPGQEVPSRREQVNRLARSGVPVYVMNRAGKNPRVAAQQGLLAARLENQVSHLISSSNVRALREERIQIACTVRVHRLLPTSNDGRSREQGGHGHPLSAICPGRDLGNLRE